METESQYDNITSYVSDSQNKTLLISSRTNSWSLEDNSNEKYTQAAELPPPPKPAPISEKEIEEEEEVEIDPAVLAARAERRATAIKKRKRIFKQRLKKRKRARKYRGKCPRI